MEQIKIIREALNLISPLIAKDAVKVAIKLNCPVELATKEIVALHKALQALTQLEIGMQSVSERSIDIPILETYEFDRSQYIKVNFKCKRNQETGQLEQPTVNEVLLKQIDAYFARQAAAPDQKGFEGYPRPPKSVAEQMLLDCKNALSQVKPSIWKKYPDEKPKPFSKVVMLICYNCRESLICGNYQEGDEYCYIETVGGARTGKDLFIKWCYEADLIKTIGE